MPSIVVSRWHRPARPPKFNAQLLAGFLLAAALPLIILEVIQAFLQLRQREEESAVRLGAAAASLASGTDLYLEKHLAAIRALADTIEQDRTPLGAADLGLRIGAFRRHFPDFRSLVAVTPDGNLVAGGFPRNGAEGTAAPAPAVALDLDSLRELLRTGQPLVSEVFEGVGPDSGPLVTLRAPVRGPPGGWTGIVEGALDLGRLGSLASGLERVESRHALVVDDRQRIVYATARAGAETLASTAGWRLTPRPKGATGAWLEAPQPDGRSTRYLAAVAALHTVPWRVVVRRSAGELRASTLRAQTVAGLCALAALALVLPFALVRASAATTILEQTVAARTTELRASEAMLREFLDTTDELVQSADPQGRMLFANRAWLRALEYEPQDLARLTIWDIVDPENVEHCQAEFGRITRGESVGAIEATFRSRNGRRILVSGHSSCSREDGQALYTRSFFRDITVQRASETALRESEEQNRALVEESLGLIYTHDPDGRLLSVNPAAARTLGFEPEELLGRSLLEILSERARARFPEYLATARNAGTAQGLLEIVTKAGVTLIWQYQNRLISNPGRPEYVLGYAVDVTARTQADSEIRRQALTDPLTGLSNRALFQDRLRWALDQAERDRLPVAVIYLDLDDFKPINDQFGHAAGDYTLIEVGSRLKSCLRRGTTVARLGGDEFGIVVSGLGSRDNAEDLVRRLLARLQEPLAYQGASFQVSASIGVSLYPEDGADVETLVAAADRAMYRRKAAGAAISH